MAAALLIGTVFVMTAGASSPGPAFVQQVSAHASGVTSLTVTPASNVTSGNRLVVETGVWSSAGATMASVTDSAGDQFVEALHFTGPDGTEMSVWTAPVTAAGGTRPTITAKPTAKADVGVAVLEYSGLSTVAASTVVDQMAHSSGTTTGAATVSSGATPATTAANELALGLYVDSGFGDTLAAGSGYTQRANVSNAGDMELLAEDQIVGSGATPNATASTGANTVWLMATIVLKSAGGGTATVPAAPTNVSATAGDGSATISWTAPSNGGSAITSYTVVPYIGSSAQTPTTVTASPPVTSATINGLTNGTAYTFTVSATNAVGPGPASSPSSPVTPSASSGGQWSAPMAWPMVAIHSILLHNGKVLQFDGWQQPEPTQVWDPGTQTFATQTAPDSIFCSGMAQLPDGRVLVVGGYGGLSTGNLGIVDTNIFDPTTNTWTRVANMHSARWYPDLTELADGRYVAISGNSTNATTWADTPEVFDPSTGQWTALSGVSTSQVHEEEYPFSYLAPSGNVFTIGTSEDRSFFLNVGAKAWTPVGGSSGIANGSSVMYRPGKVLYSGGAATLASSSPAQSTTAVIDVTAATPTWRQTASMANARIYHTLTMLADGTVLAVGGEPTAGQTGNSEVSGGVLPSEIWNPATERWSAAAATGATRGYHSTAVLMPDGTVLVAGSGHANPGYPGQYSAQTYSPPYLFKGPRPTIASVPAATTYGSSISISTPNAGSIVAVNLVSLGADTHQSDMNQHFVPLGFTPGSGSLTVHAPSSGALAPPGDYMLFIVNSNGVPSVASFIHIAATLTAPSAPSGVSASAGNASASVSWTAPGDGGSAITSYTVTPYIGSTAQTPTTVSGSPLATSATVAGLSNGATYTFTVSATNAVGTGPASAPSNSVTPGASSAPAFVQQVSAHSPGVSSLTVTPSSSVAAGDRLLVQVGVWNAAGATAGSVTDSAGNQYVELLHYTASDNTEMSVWTAPVTVGGGTRPTITVKTTSSADVGVAALEYSGLSTVADATVVDQMAHASGTTTGAATVFSGATPATTAANELAVGLYADSGFGDTLTPGSGYTGRVNVSNSGDMELLVEDQPVGTAATPNATVGTGANTIWQMAAIVLKSASAQTGSANSFTLQVRAALEHQPIHGRGITRNPARSRRAALRHVQPRHLRGAAARRRSSLRRAAAIAASASSRFVYDALLKHLSPGLLCHHDGQSIPRHAARIIPGWPDWWWAKPRAA